MIRIEYLVPTAGGATVNHVMFADDFEEAEAICDKCDEYGYQIVDVSRFIEE